MKFVTVGEVVREVLAAAGEGAYKPVADDVFRGDWAVLRQPLAEHWLPFVRRRDRPREGGAQTDESARRGRAGHEAVIVEMKLGKCQVRSWRVEDAQLLASHANNRRVWINLRDRFPHPFVLADALAFIQEALVAVPETRFAIAVDNAAVGGIGFTLHDDVERVSAEIGYWLGEPFWGRGIMTEALAAVTAYALRTHDLTRVFAVPYEWNPASFRVLEKAGYVCEGHMRRSAIKDGCVIGQRLYAYVVPSDPSMTAHGGGLPR